MLVSDFERLQTLVQVANLNGHEDHLDDETEDNEQERVLEFVLGQHCSLHGVHPREDKGEGGADNNESSQVVAVDHGVRCFHVQVIDQFGNLRATQVFTVREFTAG